MKGDKTLAELAQLFDVHPNQVTQWRSQVLEGAAGLFGADGGANGAAFMASEVVHDDNVARRENREENLARHKHGSLRH